MLNEEVHHKTKEANPSLTHCALSVHRFASAAEQVQIWDRHGAGTFWLAVHSRTLASHEPKLWSSSARSWRYPQKGQALPRRHRRPPRHFRQEEAVGAPHSPSRDAPQAPNREILTRCHSLLTMMRIGQHRGRPPLEPPSKLVEKQSWKTW